MFPASVSQINSRSVRRVLRLASMLKNLLGASDERCWERGIKVTAHYLKGLPLCAVRHIGALALVSKRLCCCKIRFQRLTDWGSLETHVGSHACCGCSIKVSSRGHRQRGRGSRGKEYGGEESQYWVTLG